jgi:prophage maintenance system killer protein
LVASAFLEVNGLKVIAPEEEFEKLVMDAAQSVVTKEQISEFFKRHTERV